MDIEFSVNGEVRKVYASPFKRLLDVLREDLRLTGTKEGCGEGECGACSVWLDGAVVNACLVTVGQCHRREVRTVEGLSEGTLSTLQDAFVRHGATQCGICTPGIVVCAADVVQREPTASRERLRELLAGNLCRCTGYQLIVDAVASVLPSAPADES